MADGLVTVMSESEVLMKVVIGRGGERVREIAEALKAKWPLTAEAAYDIVRSMGIAGETNRVVITADEIYHRCLSVPSSCRKTFRYARFNPQHGDGKTDHLMVVSV